MGFSIRSKSEDANPLLIWGQRFLVVVLFMVSVLALAADRLFPGQSADLRSDATDILAPMIDAAGAPVRWSKRRVAGIDALINTTELAAQAETLQREIDALQLELARRNARIAELRANVNLPPEGLESYLSARVLLQGESLFARSLVLNIGTRDRVLLFDRAFSGAFIELDPATGQPLSFVNPCQSVQSDPVPDYCRVVPVRDGLAVVTRRGILGRLQSVGYNSSRVRLITSQDSALPVLVGEFRVKGTVFGNDTNVLTLQTSEALPGVIQIGDEVLTSNIDADIPFLFRVGQVVATSPTIQVAPAALGADGIDNFVQVVLTEPLDQSTLDETLQ